MAASTKSMGRNKRKVENLSVDEFMMGGFDSSSSESDKKAMKSKKTKNSKKKDLVNTGKMKIPAVEISKKKKSALQMKKQSGVLSKHKTSLEDLKNQDPEFYEFLKDEDESLLQFGEASGSDITDSSDDDNSKSDDVDNGDGSDIDDDIELPESSEEEDDDSEPKKKTKTMAKKKGQDTAKAAKKKEAKATAKDKKKAGKEEGKSKKRDRKDENVEESGEESDDEDEAFDFDLEGSDDDSDEEQLHMPGELEEMSDSDADEEDDGENKAGKKEAGSVVTMKMVQGWTARFKENASVSLVHEVAQAFRAAVQQTASKAGTTKYVVQGGKVFNAVVRLCLVEMPPALQKLVDLPETKDLQKPTLPSGQNKHWKKIKLDVKFYLSDVLQLMTNLSEENMVNVLLKHVHRLVAFFASFPKLTKTLVKKLITIWSEGQEASRVLAFLCINRVIRTKQDDMLDNCMKQMYMAYVKNCKFTSPNSLPLINFMQRSYVEILSLDFGLAYQYAFMYIRQLAIHLRSAISTKKKESCQAVYNWQYIHCLGLWSRVLSMTYPNEVLEPLIYPLVQTTIGTIKLIPTARYYPLRFHCVKHLSMLSRSTNTYIPVLPFLLEVFEMTDFNKKPKAVSMKPLNFACILKLSKPQLTERSFKEGVIDQLYELLLECFHANAHTIGFPELALPALIQLKGFLKSCKVSNFTKQIKQIVDKVKENSEFITSRRRSTTISLADRREIARWERECEEAGTPLGKFYKTWRKLRDRELMHQIANRDQIVDMDTKLPEIKRSKGQLKATEDEKKEFSALFEGNSDNEEDLAVRFLPYDEKKKLKKEQEKENKKSKKKQEEENDFDSDELEQLAGSGPDDSDDEIDDEEDDDDSDADSDDEEEGNEEEEDSGEDVEDIVEEFTMSSDED